MISEDSPDPESISDEGKLAAGTETGGQEPRTIAEVMDWARKRIAALSGARMEAVKLNCHIET